MKRKIFIPLLLLGGLVLTSCNNVDSGTSITEVKLNKSYLKLTVGESFNLVASTIGGEKTVAFFSSDANVASVDANGVVKGVSEGDATIYATANDKVASCNVKVAKHFYEPKTSIRNGSFKVNLDIDNQSEYTLAAPLRYEYQSLGGALDTEDTKVNFDLEFTKGLASEGKSETEQALDNINFVSFLMNTGLLGDDSLPYRALGYTYRTIKDELDALETLEAKEAKLKELNEEHLTFGSFNDRLVFNAYNVENATPRVRLAHEEAKDEEEDTDYKELIDLISNIKLDANTLIIYDYVSILRTLFDGETVIIDDEGSNKITLALKLLGAMIFLFSSSANLSYKPVTIEGLKGAELHLFMNGNANTLIDALAEYAGDYSVYFENIDLENISLDFTLLQDKSVDSYNHLYSLCFNANMKVKEKAIDLKIETNLGANREEKEATYFSEINQRQNRFNNVMKEVDRYITKLGDVISYSDSDDRTNSVSLLDSRYNEMLGALDEFASLSDNAKFVIHEEKFNKDEIKGLYDTGRALLVTASNGLNDIWSSSSIEDVYNCVEPIYNYLDYKEALRQKNEGGFSSASNVIEKYLRDIQSEIESGINKVKALDENSTLDEMKEALLDVAPLFSQTGLLKDLLPRQVLNFFIINAKYDERLMLTDELEAKRKEVISSSEEYNENDELKDNLYSLGYFYKEAFRLYVDRLTNTYNANELYDELNLGLELVRTDFGKIVDAASVTLSDTVGYITVDNVSSLLNDVSLTLIAASLLLKYNEIKESTLEAFANLKVDPSLTNKAAWALNEASVLIIENNIKDIQGTLLDAARQLDMSFLDEIITEGNALIL